MRRQVRSICLVIFAHFLQLACGIIKLPLRPSGMMCSLLSGEFRSPQYIHSLAGGYTVLDSPFGMLGYLPERANFQVIRIERAVPADVTIRIGTKHVKLTILRNDYRDHFGVFRT